MKQTVLKQPAQALSKKLSLCAALCVFAAAATLGCNILLALTFTENTRTAYLLANILSDAIVGSLLLLVFCAYFQPNRKLLLLARQTGNSYTAAVESVSPTPLRYLGVDCLEVLAEGRRLFLPCDTIRLETGVRYRFHLASNVIMEAER